MRTAIVAIVTSLAWSLLVFLWGYSQGKNAVKLDNFEEYKTLIEKRDSLQTELNNKDIALLEAQRERNELRDKKVTQYVKVYRDRIKDLGVAECVRNSGLLDVYDATLSTSSK